MVQEVGPCKTVAWQLWAIMHYALWPHGHCFCMAFIDPCYLTGNLNLIGKYAGILQAIAGQLICKGQSTHALGPCGQFSWQLHHILQVMWPHKASCRKPFLDGPIASHCPSITYMKWPMQGHCSVSVVWTIGLCMPTCIGSAHLLLAHVYWSAVYIKWNLGPWNGPHKITYAAMGCSKYITWNTWFVLGTHIRILIQCS